MQLEVIYETKQDAVCYGDLSETIAVLERRGLTVEKDWQKENNSFQKRLVLGPTKEIVGQIVRRMPE